MSYPEIRVYPDPALRQVCKPTHPGPRTTEILDEMFEAMDAEGGIGLAANQLGYDVRLVVMKTQQHPVTRMINPRIVSRSGVNIKTRERCLSVPTVTRQRTRSWSVQVQFETEHGKHKTIKLKDYEAACIQHEIDHLDARLVIDD